MVMQRLTDAVAGSDGTVLDTGCDGDQAGSADRTGGVAVGKVAFVCRSGQKGDARVGRIGVVDAYTVSVNAGSICRPDPVHGIVRHDPGESVLCQFGGGIDSDFALSVSHGQVPDHGVCRGQVFSAPASFRYVCCSGTTTGKAIQYGGCVSDFGVGNVQGSFGIHSRCAALTCDGGFVAQTGSVNDEHGVRGENGFVRVDGFAVRT